MEKIFYDVYYKKGEQAFQIQRFRHAESAVAFCESCNWEIMDDDTVYNLIIHEVEE